MCGCVYVWVCVCVCGFCNVGCLVICVLVCTVFLYCFYCVFCIVLFMYIYSYLFCLYWCQDYCHRVTTQLPLIIIIIIIIIINQALQTKYYVTKVLNIETDSKCRLCQQFDETIDHIISACQIVAKEQYVKRHDRVCAQLHFNICKETAVQLDKVTGMNMCQNQ